MKGTWQTPLTPLTPFKINRTTEGSTKIAQSKLQGSLQDTYPFWTSLDVQDISKLGFSYPPIRSGKEGVESANRFINEHYAWFQPRGTGVLNKDGIDQNLPVDMSKVQALPMLVDGKWVPDLTKMAIDGDPMITIDNLYSTPTTSLSSSSSSSSATQLGPTNPSNTSNPTGSGSSTEHKSDVQGSSSAVIPGTVTTKSHGELSPEPEAVAAVAPILKSASQKSRTPVSQGTAKVSTLTKPSASTDQVKAARGTVHFASAAAEKLQRPLPQNVSKPSSTSKNGPKGGQTRISDEE